MNKSVQIKVCGELLGKIIQGLRSGKITAPTMLDTRNPNANEYPIITLDELIEQRLSEVGIILIEPKKGGRK